MNTKTIKISLKWVGMGFQILSLILLPIEFWAQDVGKKEYKGKGKEVFNNKGCIACHDFSGTDKPIGPSLKGVTKRVSAEWLQKWLKNPDEVKKTDKYAQDLDKKFPTSNMLNLNLTDQEIKDIIDYLKWMDTEGSVSADFKPLSPEEFEIGRKIYFQHCSGCHGAKRWGATGPSLLPNSHIVNAKEVPGGGTREKGTEAIRSIIWNGTPAGMPPWGKEGILNEKEVDIMARYVQMDPPEVPKLGMEEAKKSWELLIKPEDRPKTDPTQGKYLNYFGVILRDAGKVAIIDGTTKKLLSVVDSGYATHILRSSHSGRYFYTIGRDGRVGLIDLWFDKPKLVAKVRTCWDARSVDSSKAPGYEDKYAIVGCYTPNQYWILDGQTLEPLFVKSVADSRDWATGNKLPEVRVASIVASEDEPFWVINLKESGWVYLIDYRNPKNPKETRLKADNFLHDGGWVKLPGKKEKRYFLVAANAKNKMCIVDTVEHKVINCIDTGKIPHPGRGANIIDPEYGPVYVTGHIGDDKLVYIGVDPEKYPQYAWKVVREIKTKSPGNLFVKSHPNSNHLWFDMPLSSKQEDGTFVNGQVGVVDIKTGKIIKYIQVSPKRVVHFEYDKDGQEVWISGWLENKIYVYDDKTLKLKKVIEGDWLKTPTGKFNVYNTSKDIY
jgi:nitrite reductase (NO-forming)/hydroxylamine reductase